MARTIKLAVGAVFQCSPTFLDQNGRSTTSSGATTYVSSVPAAATVDSNGKATAIAAGTTTITATHGSFTATLTIIVYVPTLSSMSM